MISTVSLTTDPLTSLPLTNSTPPLTLPHPFPYSLSNLKVDTDQPTTRGPTGEAGLAPLPPSLPSEPKTGPAINKSAPCYDERIQTTCKHRVRILYYEAIFNR